MVHWMGRTRRILAMGMLAAALLGGCGSTGGGLPASSIQILEGEAEEETMAQELQKQIVAVLNVKRPLDKRMTSDAALEQAASFFLDYLLQDPNIDLSKMQNPTNLGGMLTDKDNYAFVYDGELSAVQVGRKVLDKLEELDERNRLIALKSKSKSFQLTQIISFMLMLALLVMGKVSGYEGFIAMGVGLAFAFAISMFSELFTYMYYESKN